MTDETNEELTPRPTEKTTPAPIYDLASKIKPFCWSADHQYKAFVQHYPFDHLPKDALHYLEIETGWTRVKPIVEDHWDRKTAIAVGLGQMECPFCSNNKHVWRLFVGTKTGLRTKRPVDCHCIFYLLFIPRWHDVKYVSKDYQQTDMSNIGGFSANFGGFKEKGAFDNLLEVIKTHKRNCMLWVGQAGTGKTTLMTAMYHEALTIWAGSCFEWGTGGTPAVWKINAPALAKQHKEWAMKDEGRDAETGAPTMPPDITPNTVQAAIRDGHIPYLFLEEFDKVKLDSEFQAKEFAALFDAIQSNGGVVIASANCTEQQLQYKLGKDIGPAIIRRLIGPRLNSDKPNEPTNPDRCGILINFGTGAITLGLEAASPSSSGNFQSSSSNRSFGDRARNNGYTPRADTVQSTYSDSQAPTQAGVQHRDLAGKRKLISPSLTLQMWGDPRKED